MPNKFHFSVLFEVVNKATKPVRAVARSMNRLKINIKSTTNALGKMGEKAKKIGSKMVSVGKKIALAFGGIAGGALVLALKSSANIETLQTAFESMTGSAEKGKEVVEGLIKFTAKTPFQLEGVGKAGKQLLSFGVSTKELQNKLQFLGDIAAGANVPLTDMAAIFGKSKAKGKAMTEELLQLSDRGIPVIDVLSKQLNVSKNEIFEMASKGKISFDIIEKALISMTKKGGLFHKQMEKQSSTLAGLYSTLKDNVILVFAKIGDQFVKAFNIKEHMKNLIAWMQKKEVKDKLFSVIKGVFNWVKKIIRIFTPLGRSLLRLVKVFTSASKGGGFFLKMIEGIVWVLGKAVDAVSFLIQSVKVLGIVWGDHDAELEATTRTYGAMLRAAKKLKKQYEKETDPEKKSSIYKQYMKVRGMLRREGGKKESLMKEKTDVYKDWNDILNSWQGKNNLKSKNDIKIPSGLKSLSKPSKAEVNIKVSADAGTTAIVDKVKKKGETKISLINESYLGMVIPA